MLWKMTGKRQYVKWQRPWVLIMCCGHCTYSRPLRYQDTLSGWFEEEQKWEGQMCVIKSILLSVGSAAFCLPCKMSHHSWCILILIFKMPVITVAVLWWNWHVYHNAYNPNGIKYRQPHGFHKMFVVQGSSMFVQDHI